MFTRSLKKFAPAAALALTLTFAYQSFAGPLMGSRHTSTERAARSAQVIYGLGVARFGSYQLNVAFTPEGKVVCFNISAL